MTAGLLIIMQLRGFFSGNITYSNRVSVKIRALVLSGFGEPDCLPGDA